MLTLITASQVRHMDYRGVVDLASTKVYGSGHLQSHYILLNQPATNQRICQSVTRMSREICRPLILLGWY
jgi:hypothetical protein